MVDNLHSDPTVELVNKSGSLDFEAAACFKLNNIKRYFEDDPAAKRPPSIWTPFFGPRLRLHICSSRDSTKGINVYLYLPDSDVLSRPTFISLILTFSSSTTQNQVEKKTYHTWTISREWMNDNGWGLLDVIPVRIWEEQESLRLSNSVEIDVKVVGSLSQTPTPQSSGVLNILHQNITDAPRSVFRFSTFDRRDRMKKYERVSKLLADREILQKTCPVLYDNLTGKLQWKGFIIDGHSDGILDEVGSDEDSDFECDEELTQISARPCLGSEHSESHEPRYRAQKIKDDDDPEQSAEQDLQKNPESTVGKNGHDYYILDGEDKMQVDSGDNKLGLSKSVQTDSLSLSFNGERVTDVIVVGAAAATWEAFLFYLYTGIIEFAPLSSRGRTERDAYLNNFKAINRPKPCSPKSIYRLAQAMNQIPLKQLALKKIIEGLSVDNILPELFSVFTSKHEEVQEQELAYFSGHSDEIMASQAFRDLIMDIAMGSYPHAGKTLGDIFQKVRNSGQNDQKSSSNQKNTDADTGTSTGKEQGGKKMGGKR
ncbi:hypothetical protein EIP86_005996 [Pleurotus ostreatoroseus]|nr:hypothetical protein EIP86_005996 [Pleurotus ostreatoroseus]